MLSLLKNEKSSFDGININNFILFCAKGLTYF